MLIYLPPRFGGVTVTRRLLHTVLELRRWAWIYQERLDVMETAGGDDVPVLALNDDGVGAHHDPQVRHRRRERSASPAPSP